MVELVGNYTNRPHTRILIGAHHTAPRADDVVRVPEVPGANKTEREGNTEKQGFNKMDHGWCLE